MAKLIVALVWIWGLASALVPGLQYATLGIAILKALVVIHLFECVIFLPAARRTGGPLAYHMAMIFLFGVFHYREMALATGGANEQPDAPDDAGGTS